MENRISGSFHSSLFLCLTLLLGACGATTVGPTPRADILTDLHVVSLPTKTTYQVGEPFDPAGMVVEGTFANGKTQQIPVPDLVFRGFDSSVPVVQQVVTVSYSGMTDQFTVTIE